MAGGIDWSKVAGAGSSRPTSPSGGGIDWSAVAGSSDGSAPSSTQAGAVAPPKGGKGIGGFLSKVGKDAGSMVASVVPGIGHLAGDVGRSLKNSARLQLYNDHLIGKPTDLQSQPGESLTNYVARVSPGGRDFAQPTIQAGRTIGGLAQEAGAPGHGLADEMEARYSAHPLQSLVSDAAGAAVVLGPASKLAAAGSAGEGGAIAGGLSKAASAANKVASLPMWPYEFAAGKVLSLPAVADAMASAKEALANHAVRKQFQDLRETKLLMPLNAANKTTPRPFMEAAKTGVTPEEQGAAVLGHLGIGDALASSETFAKLPSDQQNAAFTSVADKLSSPDNPVSADSVALAYHHATGTLPEDSAARIDAASQAIGDVAGTRQAREAAGTGRLGGPLHPEQMGDQPLTAKTTAGLGPDDIAAAPARFRPVLTAVGAGVDHLGQLAESVKGEDPTGAALLRQVAGELPKTLSEATAAGVNPTHLKGTRPEQSILTGTGNPSSTGAPLLRKLSSEKERTGTATAFTLQGQANLETKALSDSVRNEFAKSVVGQFGKSAADAGLPDGLHGEQLVREMDARGYAPFRPTATLSQGRITDPSLVDGSTVFLPKTLIDHFAGYERDILGTTGKVFDKATRGFYKAALHLSPAYWKLFALSDLALAGTAGEVSPIAMIRLAPKAIAAVRSGEFPELMGGGPLSEESQFLKTGEVNPSKLKRFASAPSRAGDAVAGTVDNFARALVALDKIGKGASRDEAMLAANKAIGLYQSLSPVERDVIRRVFPVYPWAKHVATAMAQFAGDHPLKTLFLLHLGAITSQDQDAQGVSSFVRGDVDLGGGKYLDMRGANPLDIFTSTPGGFINPLLKAGIGVSTGIKPGNLGTGRPLEMSRPPTGAQHGPLSLSQAAHYITQQQPLGKTYQNLTEQPVTRYDTGEPKLVNGRLEKNPYAGRGSVLGQYLANPIKNEPPPTPQQLAKTKKAQQSQAKSAARYIARLKAAQHKK
jgi:hypothetical protein